jgi:hypothetical protein
MTTAADLPDLADLRVLGASTTEVWAGANDPVSRGLVAWAGRAIGDDRAAAVRAAYAACQLVVGKYPADTQSDYIDRMLDAVKAWLAEPTREHQEDTMKALDVTRQHHAWQAAESQAGMWILEAVDHAGLAVWSHSELSIYITPAPPRTCAARATACVFHSLVAHGLAEADACNAVVAAVAVA